MVLQTSLFAGVRLLSFVNIFVKQTQIYFRHEKDALLFGCGNIKVGGMWLINILRNSADFYSSFCPALVTISVLAETVSVIYYARNGCDKDEFLEKS